MYCQNIFYVLSKHILCIVKTYFMYCQNIFYVLSKHILCIVKTYFVYCQNIFYLFPSIATLYSALSLFMSSLRHLLLLPMQQFCQSSVQDSLIGVPAIYCDYFYNCTTTCSLRQADRSSRGVLPTVVRRCL